MDELSNEPPPTPEEMGTPEPAPTSSGGDHPLHTTAEVKEPDGSAAPISIAPDDLANEPPPTAEELAGPTPQGPNAATLQFVSGAGDLPKPDHAAEIIRYSAASGLPANLVAADLENVKRQVDASNVDWKKLVERQPALAQYMAENPHAIPLVQSDTHNLGMAEWALKAPFAALMDAVHNQGTIGLQTLRAEGVKGLDPTIQQRLDDEKASEARFGPNYGAENLATQGVIGLAKAVPYFALDKVARIIGGTVGAVAGAAAGAETGPGAVVTGTIGGGLSQFAASGVFNYAEAIGPLSWELDHLKDEQGRAINPAVANVAAQAGSVASGALMAGAMGLFAGKAAGAISGFAKKAVPGVAQALAGVGENAVMKWMADNEVRDTISKFIGRWGLHTAIGAGMMAANSAVTAAATESAKKASGLDAKWTNISDAAANGGAQGFKDLWLLSAIPAVQQHMADQGLARASAESVARLELAVTAAKESTTLDKSPEAFERVMDLTAPNAKVYVPAERWQSYFQDKKLDPAQVAQSVGVRPEDLTNALSTGGNLEITASKFLSGLAKDGHADGLAMDVKSSPELLTAREFKARQDTEAKRLVDDAKSRATELDSGKQAIQDFVVDQAKASGLKLEGVRAGAKLLAESAATQALRLNVSMQEAARLMNYGELSVTGKGGPTPAHEAAAQAFREWLAPSASQQLKARQGSMAPENLARELYLDQNTGLPNGLHFDELNSLEGETSFPADQRAFANVGVEGTKFVNDSRDHEQGDLLYRAAAKALHEAAPEANVSKTGGDFELRVKDQAHLEDILKRANEAMPEGLRGFTLTGAAADTREGAEKAHVEFKQAAEKSGERAPRGQAPKGFTGNIGELKFPTEKVAREPHPELAKQIAGLTPEEYFKKAYVEPKTGLLTGLGWEKVPRKRYTAALDLKGLKPVNEAFGKSGGDAMIRRFGELATHVGGSSFDLAHLHGDEYAAQHDDPAKLQAFIDSLRRKVNDVGVRITRPDGTKARLPIGFRHGIGKGTYEAADAELNRRKKLEGSDTTGAGNELAEAPEGQHGGTSGRSETDGKDGDPGRDPLRGPPSLGAGDERRGGSPQVYPGSQRSGRGGSFNQEAVAAPQAIQDARAFIGRMRDQEKASLATAFLEYATGGSDRRPEGVPPKLEQELADKFGIVDPAGYGFDENGRNMERALGGRKSFGQEPEELRKYRLSRTMDAADYMALPEKYFKQEPIAHIEGEPVIFKQDPPDEKGNPRGEIRLDVSGSGRPRAFDIRILGGDKSTFAHEVAHFLSWSLHDLATSDLATDQTRADYDTLLKFAGYETAGERLKAISEGGGKAQEERISHGFEQYLSEGKAPSLALTRVFTRFKDWLLRIYKGAEGVQAQYRERYGQEIQLSDDVRQVFDRLLAQDEALKQATQAVGGTGELKEAMAGMTPAQAESYRKAISDARAKADQEVTRGGDERQKALDAQREVFRKQTEDELDTRPVYRAWRYLQHGDLPEGATPPTDNDGKPFKIARGDFEREYGEDTTKRLPPNSLKSRGGIPVDVLAPVLGFNSGDDLVNALKEATPRDDAIAQGTQDKMDAAHGPELERATESALSGVHNARDLEAAVMELRGLAKQINPELERQARAIDTDALRRNIDRMTGEKLVEQLDPEGYARTERKLALEAAELWGKGEKEASYDKREQRLVNKLLFMSERDAKAELDSARRRIENPSDSIRADLGKADPAYRDAHDAILAAVGLGPTREGAKTLDEMLATADRDGHEMGPWVDTVRKLIAQPAAWDNSLSVDQARDVSDAIENIRHAADESLNATILGKRQALDDIRLAIAKRTAAVQPAVPRPAYGGKESSLLEKAESKRRGLSAALQDIETISEMMDGGTSGPVHDLLINSRLEARDREVELIRQVLEPLKKAFDKVPKNILRLRDQSVDVAQLLPPPPGREPGYVRSFLWSLFLNMGNDGNLQRLADGNKWEPHNMRRAVGLLSEPELDFLQTVRDTANSLFPELSKAYEARTGLKLEKVQATPTIVNGKEYSGGYWPIRYDASYEGNQGNRQEINDIKDLFPSSRSPIVANSSTKARQTAVLAPIDLTWSVVPSHFAQVIHDISYGDWVRQAAKVLMKPRIPNPAVPSFDKTATDYLGPERAKEFLPWLRDVASARADSNSGHVADAVRDGSFLRSRFTAAAIMLNIPSSIRHLADPWTTIADSEAVLPQYISGAYLKVMNPASWGNTPEFKLSKELSFRQATHDDNLRGELQKMGKVTGALQRATEVGFATHKWLDMFTTRVGFKAAYDQAIANGATQGQAVQRADEVVRRSFPSTDVAEKPPILRTKQGWAAAVMFYGYASKMHNLRSRSFDSLNRAWNAEGATGGDETAPDQGSRAGAIATTAAKMIGLGLVSAMGSYFAGRGPTQKEDDDKGFLVNRAEWLATETLLSPMDDAPPVVGPALKATLLGHKTNIASVPELSLVDHQLQRLGEALHGKEKEDDDKAWSLAEGLIGAMGPVGQAHRTVPYVHGLLSGVEQPRGPLDAAAGVLYGDGKYQGANPLTDAQSAVSGR